MKKFVLWFIVFFIGPIFKILGLTNTSWFLALLPLIIVGILLSIFVITFTIVYAINAAKFSFTVNKLAKNIERLNELEKNSKEYKELNL